MIKLQCLTEAKETTFCLNYHEVQKIEGWRNQASTEL